MLNIVWGRAHAPHARYLMDEAAALARGGQKRQILLAPEPFSHETERLLCELGGDAISLSCEVLTFTRLIHRVLAAEGGLADARLDPAGRLLLLSRALEAVRPSLTRWGRKAGSPLFLERLMATIDELKAYEAKPEALSVPPGEAASGPSAGKLNDLRLIWEAFDALAARVSVSDPRDLPSRVAELIDTCPYAGGTRLYIDGFISFTAQERRIVSAFIRRADAVTFCAPAPPPGFEDGAAHWEQPRGTAAALEREARRYGVKVTHHTLPCDDTAYHPALRRVETLVMGGGPDIPDIEKTPPSRDALILHEAADVFAECEWAAELARSWVDGPQGVRCRDIVISAPDWELYGAALESACLRRGLPLFTDSAAPLTHKAAARFMTSALEAAADGMSADSVIALIKTGLTPLTADQSFMLEDYIRVHGVQGAHWSRAEPWTAHPSGWGETGFSERDRERLGAVNSARERLRGPLTALRAAFGRARSGLGYTRALYDFCESMELPQSLAANCERLEARGLEQQAAEGRRLWDVLCRAMDTCAELIENWECAPDTFNHLFGLCLTQYGVGVIPIALDRMQAGPYDRLRRRAPRRLIMLGASEPFMPRANEAPGLLTDEERVLIELNGVSLAPRAEERASRELFNLYRCFSMPSETLAVCRPVAIDGAPSRPSLFFERLAALWDGADNEPEVGLAADAGSKADAGPWVSGRAPLGERSAGILFSGGGALSPIRMQTYQTCRFQYFARYALRARPRPEPGPRPSAAGSLIHDALRVMVEGVMERGGFRAVTRAEALEMAGRAAGEYARALPGRELRTARELRLLAGLRATALTVAGDVFDELERSDFAPLAAELPVSAPLSGGVTLRGVIDRVDGWVSGGKYYLRVVDYKSGRVKFSLGDVRYGLGIQTLCYLFALDSWDGLPAVPAGALYLPAHDRPVSAKSNAAPEELERLAAGRRRRDGLILCDMAVADAMERGADKVFIPARFNESGHAAARSKTATAEQMELLRLHVARVAEDICAGMRSGDVSACPVSFSADESACDYCEAKQACLFDARLETGRRLAPVTADEFWASLADAGGRLEHGL